jgi:hypothetical protein
MIRAGFGAQMADGKPQMAGTEQMAADGRWQEQMADGRISAIWNRANSETWCSWQMAAGFGLVLCHLRIMVYFQSLGHWADGVAEAIPTG